MKVVFLDRDGVINKKIENGYVLYWKDFEFLPDVDKAIKLLNENRIPVIVISNQACVGKGLITRRRLDDINGRMMEELKKKGAHIDDIFVCPHKAEDDCGCRKPRTGLFKQASEKHDIDFKGSLFIGDSPEDAGAGCGAGCNTYLLKNGENLMSVVEKALKQLK